MKVLLSPKPESIQPNSGIGRIVHAQYKYLPELGVQFVNDESSAEVVACHTQMFDYSRIDVLMCHGLYWTGDPRSGKYAAWHHSANHKIVEAARRSEIVTVPSDWVAEPFRRDMRLSPIIVPHGIDFAEWMPAESLGYLLWNKNRSLDVCDPSPAWEMAERGIPVVSTFAPDNRPATTELRVVGEQPHEKMQELVQKCGVYLATTRETFGIGTLEAMACGKPVLGFDWGGTRDLVRHQETGYLVTPYDYEALYEGWDWIQKHYAELSKAAREQASRYDWSKVMPLYVGVYECARTGRQNFRGSVSIVITNHNYAGLVGDAIQSALAQTFPCEVVVVDDGSTDGSLKSITPFKSKIKIISQPNLGVAEARNRGIREASGDFLICLDADDWFDPQYAEVCRAAMVEDRGLGIAYTGLLTHIGMRETFSGWPPEFRWEVQAHPGTPPPNVVPCAAMFSRAFWQRAGGFKQEYAPGEDAEFFTRGLANGFTARRVVEERLFHYRIHGESASRNRQYVPIDLFLPWVRDQSFPMAAPAEIMPLVRSYGDPLVSVVLTASKDETDSLVRAVDSILGQTLREWELILVGDLHVTGGNPTSYPFLKQITLEKFNLSKARNLGLEKARAPLVLFLKASEWLSPGALEEMARAFSEQGGRYIYTDWLDSNLKSVSAPDYDPMAALKGIEHLGAVLLSTAEARTIKYDETLRLRSEAEFFAHLASAGVQGYHLKQPLVYISETPRQAAKSVLTGYAAYAAGEKAMPGCCGGNSGDAVMSAKNKLGLLAELPPPPPPEVPVSVGPEVVRLEFTGPQRGGQNFGGSGRTPSGRTYKGGNNAFDKYIDADPRDVAWLENTLLWRRVTPPPAMPSAVHAQTAGVQTVLERLAEKKEEAKDVLVDVPPDFPEDEKPKRRAKFPAHTVKADSE